MTAVPLVQHPNASKRVDTIDFWRGLVLCTIFINHVPGNVFEALTQKNFGFSDSAEAFVFLSGVSLALAYAPRLERRDTASVAAALARRAVRLYGVHILLSLAGIAIFTVGALATSNPALLDIHGRDLFVNDPKAALIGLVSLGHQLGYFNILPLYIVLLALALPMLWVARDHPRAMLAASGIVYVAARFWNLNIPTWPMKGSWFFDPFTWQFLMAIGVYVGASMRARAPLRSVFLTASAIAIVLLGAVSVTDGLFFQPGLQDWTRSWADLDKTVLGAGRVVHFMAVAYLVQTFGVARWVRCWRPFGLLCRLGRHSLWSFALLSLFAAVDQVFVDAFGHGLLLDCAMISSGLALLFGATALLDARRRPIIAARAVA